MPKTPELRRLRDACPDYPSTPRIDQATDLDGDLWLATEKLDGANAALFLDGDQIIVRNRTHILRRGYTKNTPAKAQFVPLWAWAHQHRKALERLNRLAGEPVVVHGEWLWALHGVRYNRLPEPFIAFAVSRWHGGRQEARRFLDPHRARAYLIEAGLAVAPLIGTGPMDVQWFVSRVSALGSELAEGVVISDGDGQCRTRAAKCIRPDYVQNFRWNDEALVRQG